MESGRSGQQQVDESGRGGQVILYALPREVDTVNQSSG